VRLLELIKLAALLERRDSEPLADALADVNARLGAAATPLQREILLSSPLDDLLLGEDATSARARALGRRRARSRRSQPFLPRRGDGLVLSASDIETYRACPLRYKFARVLRIPREPTLNQRFGILVHQVLERFHEQGRAPAERPAASGESAACRHPAPARRRLAPRRLRRLRRGAPAAREGARRADPLRAAPRRRGIAREAGSGTPRWFERSFTFPLGPHQIRGRVDRIDELPGGGYELIDYKTGLPKRAEQLREDVQLALYAVAAREAWQLEATERTYYYVLDDERVSLGARRRAPRGSPETVAEVGEGILAQAFEPTPSRAVCAMCDYRIACPAAEK
jgi:DNA helicase-2/ATP-dependent DNA helicase PcrA